MTCQPAWKVHSEVAQSYPTLCNPMDYSLPGFSVHGIFQARVLEWVAISFSRGSSWPRYRTQVSCIAGRHFTLWATRSSGKCTQQLNKYNSSAFWSNKAWMVLLIYYKRIFSLSNGSSKRTASPSVCDLLSWLCFCLKHQLCTCKEKTGKKCQLHQSIFWDSTDVGGK